MPRLRGARPSPRHLLAVSAPHRIEGITPAHWLWRPKQLSMWLNATFGDCVTAEEAFAKACHTPEIFITDQVVQEWATRNGVLNGADLYQVLNLMQSAGFEQDGYRYDDGPFRSVDWTEAPVLKNAIVQGPVKLGVAADQLQSAVPDPPVNGWMGTGFVADPNLDHCISACGFGTIQWLAAQLGGTVPRGVNEFAQGYAVYTWDSIGILDRYSLIAITGEAWLRQPTTVSLALDSVNLQALNEAGAGQRA